MEAIPLIYKDCYREIVEKTTGEIRTFLSELANGTSHYKSLHNLTEQIEHQYEGRFIIELLQNAHDVLFDIENHEDDGRVEIVVALDEKPFGALYVANDGNPFTNSNFLSLSNLGQSDKDPQKSIGNKGIGFRSVLEICKEPEVYSRQQKASPAFDGYCFRFAPSIIDAYREAIHHLVRDAKLLSPIDNITPLVLWGNTEFELFRTRYLSSDQGWLDGEMAFLSPYLLPIPIYKNQHITRINDFEKRNFATVIRMPFQSIEKRDRAIQVIEDLDENSVLFLERIRLLFIDSGNVQNYVSRKRQAQKSITTFERVDISVDSSKDGKIQDKQYWLWQRTIGGDDNLGEADQIKEAVSNLPGKWPEVRKANVAIAIRIGQKTEAGYFNIYLPTKDKSGCCAHFNGPFYGTMDRAHIVFDKEYNQLLINYIGMLAIKTVIPDLMGKDIDEARAIIDILSPAEGLPGEKWWKCIKDIADILGRIIDEEPLILTDNGWEALSYSSLLPCIDKPSLLTTEILRENATFSVIKDDLLTREKQIKALFDCFDIPSLPIPVDLANTIENVAHKVYIDGDLAQWNSFWFDVIKLFPNGDELSGKKVLIGTDGLLHSSDEKTSVFFRPRSGAQDDEILSEEAIEDIPPNLRPYIAFLHEGIQTHVPRKEGGYQLTAVQKYLALELVQSYLIEDIFREVLIRNTPQLPISLRSSEMELCRDITQWGFRLAARQISRGKGESIIGLIGKLPVPCYGGWYPLSETSFGIGWDNTVGGYLETYLKATNTKETKDLSKKVILPPYNRRWGGTKYLKKDRLEQAGILDGLNVINIDPKEWSSAFGIGGWGRELFPETIPPCFSDVIWNDYRQAVVVCERPYFSGIFQYQIDVFAALPGLDTWHQLDIHEKKAFTELVFRGGPKWEGSWERIRVKKIGGMSHSYNIESPLHYFLRNTPWIISESKGNIESFRPCDRWYIDHRTYTGGFHQFAHLKPLPPAISSKVDGNPSLLPFLRALGMPVLDLEKESNDHRLLTALANALKNPDSIINQDVFLGQVRGAWRIFVPAPNDPFINQIIVNEGPGKLVLFPSENIQVCYLPDVNLAGKDILEKNSIPIIYIEMNDAKRLKGFFKGAFGDSVQLMSELVVRPLVEGEEWNDQAEEVFQIHNSSLNWIAPVMLTILANYGTQARGTQTKRFRETIDNLRNIRIAYVQSLERVVWRGNDCILRASASGYWLVEPRILLWDSDSRSHVSKLSEALSAVLEKPDLEIALKLVLGKLEGNESPEREAIINALHEVHISGSQYAEVEQLWLGNLSWMIRLLKPMTLLFNPGSDIVSLSAIKSESNLNRYISALSCGSLCSDECLSLVRRCNGFEELGCKLYKAIGEEANLGKWNEALVAVGEKCIHNQNADNEFKAHIQNAAVQLRTILRHQLRQEPKSFYLPDLWKKLENLSCPEEFVTSFWVVPFNATIAYVSLLMTGWGVEKTVLEVVRKSGDCDVLTKSLDEMGFEPTMDPLVIYTENRERCFKMLQKVQQVAVAWCLKSETAPTGWDITAEELFPEIETHLKLVGFLDIFNERICFELIKSLSRRDMHVLFWNSLDAAADFDNFIISIGISKDELSKAEEGLRQYKEEAHRKKRLLSVCGKEFECTQENFSGLWDHITRAVSDASLQSVELDELIGLDEPPKKKKPSKKPGDLGPVAPKPKLPQAVKDLIGLAGEIHAYRTLLRQYGPTVINPSVWKSSNSRFKFPDNTFDDSIGCDFLFHYLGKEYHIEVKSTQGEDESFELGSTEIRHAVEVANKRNIRFMVLHVIDTLTENPGFRLLPNPYDSKFQRLYRIEQAGLRVRYNLVRSSET